MDFPLTLYVVKKTPGILAVILRMLGQQMASEVGVLLTDNNSAER